MRCCLETAKAAAEALKIPADGVLIGSTGVIGMQMPIEKLKKGIQILAKEKQSGAVAANAAAKAIMTTDTMEKEVAVTVEIGGKTVTIGGMAKGSGMIPSEYVHHAGFLTTDAVISRKDAQSSTLRRCGRNV